MAWFLFKATGTCAIFSDFRIASQFEHRRGAGAVEQIVEPPLVLEDQSGEFRLDNLPILV